MFVDLIHYSSISLDWSLSPATIPAPTPISRLVQFHFQQCSVRLELAMNALEELGFASWTTMLGGFLAHQASFTEFCVPGTMLVVSEDSQPLPQGARKVVGANCKYKGVRSTRFPEEHRAGGPKLSFWGDCQGKLHGGRVSLRHIVEAYPKPGGQLAGQFNKLNMNFPKYAYKNSNSWPTCERPFCNSEQDPTDGQNTNSSGPAEGSCEFSQVPSRKAKTKALRGWCPTSDQDILLALTLGMCLKRTGLLVVCLPSHFLLHVLSRC